VRSRPARARASARPSAANGPSVTRW
jgi:hypothetical protein